MSSVGSDEVIEELHAAADLNDSEDFGCLLQQIVESDVETISLLKECGTYPNLSAPSECGNYPSYMAILHDQPAVLKYLYTENVDLTTYCDTLKYATPAFYAARHGRVDCLRVLLEDCSYDLETQPCTKFGEKIQVYIRKFNPTETATMMIQMVEHGHLRHVMALKIQGRVRILLARRRVDLMRGTGPEEDQGHESQEEQIDPASDTVTG